MEEESWLQLDVLESTESNEDQFQFVLSQNTEYTKVVQVEFFLEISLPDYPESTLATLPISVVHRVCVTETFKYTDQEDITIIVGDKAFGVDIRID